MKKVLTLLLMVLVTHIAQSTEYTHLSKLPADSVIRHGCENIDEFSFLRRGSVNSACFNLNETFAQLDDLFARRDEFKTEDILAKKDEIKRLAIPILIFENQETINKEKVMIREYMRERFGSEIVDEMDKYSSSYQKK